MRILLGSSNPSKKSALEKALQKLSLTDYEIIAYSVPSSVHSKPIGFEIIRGCENRNRELKKYAEENSTSYDYLCSIEGGFSLDENGLPFVVTYCVIEDKRGKKSTGKSLGIRLSKNMWDYVKEGNSLNKAIEEITKKKKNKQSLGITGYLTDGLYPREDIDSQAVVSSFISFVYKEQREDLENYIKENCKNIE